MRKKRIALLGMHLESNDFAPVSDEAVFRTLCYMEGEEILNDLKHANPSLPAEIGAFVKAMTDLGEDWQAVPILVTAAEPGGPVEHGFFERTKAEMARRLRAAMPLDGVYFSAHGAMTSTENHDPDGELFEMVRRIIGPETPLLATLDLHANISERMVEQTDVLISYITNPHVDQEARAAEAAGLMVEMFNGMKPKPAFIRLPLVAPSITLLSAEGPYADLINYGQAAKTEAIADPLRLQRLIELQLAATAAELILEAALRRQESRGAHVRTDFPETDDANWLGQITVRQTDGRRQWGFEKAG